MEEGRGKYLLKNTIIFAIGNFGSKLINFFLLPLYTYTLTSEQYGIADLVSTVCVITIPIISLNISEAVMRFSLDKDADNDQITRIGTLIYLVGCFVCILVIPICSFSSKLYEYRFLVYFYVISAAASQIYLCDLRGKELLGQYAFGNMFQTLMIALFNVVFLIYLKWGVQGYFMAYILAYFMTAIYAIMIGKGYKIVASLYVDKILVQKMVKYSVVLIPNSFMWWIMNSSDRFMVSGMIGIAENGVYAVSYKFPTVVATTTAIFTQAWSYSAIKEKEAKDVEEFYNYTFRMMVGGVMMMGIGLMTFIKPILKVYVSNEYYEAWKYTPFLIVGCVYLTMGSFIATSYTVHKDNLGYLFSAMTGAAINIILNLLLIPVLKVYGAALATCVSYIIVFIFRLIHVRKYLSYRIDNGIFIFGSIIMLISAILIYWDNRVGFFLQIILFFMYALPIMKLYGGDLMKLFLAKIRHK